VSYVVAALVVTNLVTLFNLLLLFGVIRRLRLQETPARRPEPLAPAGTLVGDFAAVITAGDTVRRGDLPGDAVVGFFSPGCEPCEALMPEFIAYAEGLPTGPDSVLAVVVGQAGEAAQVAAAAERLSRVARVVVEEAPGGPVAEAFRVHGFPAVFRLDGAGRVLSSGTTLDRQPVAPG
jgi:thiol-disulfide isomerase/thioredoxin